MAKTEPRTSNPEPAPAASAPDAKRQAFTAAADAQQRVLVQTMRATTDGIRQAVAEGMVEEAAEAVIELNVISGFLLERCPDKLGPEDTASDVVIRLLEPHVGSRIVLPGGAG